jgi:isopropylmalate/homocitrate/citramalate synthase
VVGRGAFSYAQWGATADLSASGARPYAFPFEPEVVGRSPRLVIGKWSDLGAVAQKLTEFGLTASAEQIQTILHRSQMAGVAHHRPLREDEFLAIAQELGAKPNE